MTSFPLIFRFRYLPLKILLDYGIRSTAVIRQCQTLRRQSSLRFSPRFGMISVSYLPEGLADLTIRLATSLPKCLVQRRAFCV
jgi:hypothetical protein